MSHFAQHTPETAPTGARPILEGAQKKYGFLPNLLATMAEAPALLEGYATISGIFDKTSFNATERQVVLLTVSRNNDCRYCVAAHSVIAEGQKVPREVVDAVRGGEPLEDPRLEALRSFTARVVEDRGLVAADEVQKFLAAGFTKAQVLEVVLGVGMKTLSNYTNHLAETPVDGAFQARAWAPTDELAGVSS